MFNKRGEIELVWKTLFEIIFIVAILSAMLWFISDQARGDLIKKQILAKEVCILTSKAEPGTTIMVEHEKSITIEKKDSGIVVKKSENDPGYFYPCSFKDNVHFTTKDHMTVVEIKK